MQKGLNCIMGARVQRGQTLLDTTASVSRKRSILLHMAAPTSLRRR